MICKPGDSRPWEFQQDHRFDTWNARMRHSNDRDVRTMLSWGKLQTSSCNWHHPIWRGATIHTHPWWRSLPQNTFRAIQNWSRSRAWFLINTTAANRICALAGYEICIDGRLAFKSEDELLTYYCTKYASRHRQAKTWRKRALPCTTIVVANRWLPGTSYLPAIKSFFTTTRGRAEFVQSDGKTKENPMWNTEKLPKTYTQITYVMYGNQHPENW